MSGISQQKVCVGGSCRRGCDSLLDNERALLHHFPCLVSGQLHWDCKCAFPQRNCCLWQEALLFHMYFHLILVPIWSQNRIHLPGEQGRAGSVDGGAEVMVFLGCRESLETIHQENWRS